jgi:hypothetical protein
MYLVNWLVTALYGYQREDRDGGYALVRAYPAGGDPPDRRIYSSSAD